VYRRFAKVDVDLCDDRNTGELAHSFLLLSVLAIRLIFLSLLELFVFLVM
jgi:hypothetical protein